jgi:uncharacterized protein (TIGR02186 family)
MARGGAAILLVLGLALAVLRPAAGQDLVADLSDHLIAISTDFTGTEVVLFGAIAEPGQVAVTVRGPADPVVVRRKERVAGIWINTDSVTFEEVPSFYWSATSAPLGQIAEPAVLERHAIGLDNLRLAPADDDAPSGVDLAEFRRALVRRKQAQGTFAATEARVSFLGERLFRVTIPFPANVPTGQYTVGVLLLREGRVVAGQTTPLVVSKVGTGARVFAFAQRHSLAYGLLAVLLAVLAGWLASVLFRRR